MKRFHSSASDRRVQRALIEMAANCNLFYDWEKFAKFAAKVSLGQVLILLPWFCLDVIWKLNCFTPASAAREGFVVHSTVEFSPSPSSTCKLVRGGKATRHPLDETLIDLSGEVTRIPLA